MKTICPTQRFVCAMLALGALSLSARADATSGDSYQPTSPAKVVAHLRLSDKGARRMFLRQDGKTQYLYVQRPSQPGFTVIDVTNPERPKVVSRVPLETRTVMGSGLVIIETPDSRAAGASFPEQGFRGDETVPESVHVLEISNSAPPVIPTIDGITSVLQDPARNLIYVVNGDGVWILSHQQGSHGHKCNSSDAISSNPDCN
jgi:hypothetical protein